MKKPDGTYELVLKAIGEADWPFGSASGRLILYEGKSRISYILMVRKRENN